MAVVINECQQHGKPVPEIFFGKTYRIRKLMPDDFHKLIENNMFAGQFNIIIRIGPQLGIFHHLGKPGRLGIIESLHHNIVADIISVKLGHDQTVHC